MSIETGYGPSCTPAECYVLDQVCKTFGDVLIFSKVDVFYLPLRWSAGGWQSQFYRHVAPLEQRD